MRRGRPGLDGVSSNNGIWDSRSAAGAHRRRPPSCAEIRELLDAFHDGALDLDQTRFVAAHVAACNGCAARLAEIASVDRLIATSPAPSAPAALRSGLYARIAAGPALAQDRLAEAPRASDRHAVRIAMPGTRKARRRFSVGAAVASVVALAAVIAVVLLAAPDPHPVAVHHPHLTPRVADATSEAGASQSRTIPSLSAMPHFADWRAAYVGFDQRLHVVTADGTLDITAPMPSALGASWTSAVLRGMSVSPDGRTIASILRISPDASGPVALLSLAGGALATIHVAARALYWSPASDRLAVNIGDERQPRLAVIHPDDGAVTDLAGLVNGAPVALYEVLGWTDASHLAIIYSPPTVMVTSPVRNATPTATASAFAGTYALGALDADSGAVRQVAALPSDARSVYLTANGAEALVTPSAAGPAEVIQTASGAVRALPEITRQLAPMTSQTLAVYSDQARAQPFSTMGVWQPTSDDLAVSLTNASDSAPTLWLLDADHDAATPLGSHRTPLAWTPDGRTLLLAGSPLSDTSATPSGDAQPGLYALAPVGPGGAERLLTGRMAQFVGLVRTA